MEKKTTHMKARPPNLASFTACGLWIYEVGAKHLEKQIATVKKDVKCGRCRNTKQYRDW